MRFWDKLKRIRIQLPKINDNVPPQTAYTMIILGMIHFMVLGSALIDLRTLELFNWGIYNELVGESFQLPLMAGVMIFDAFLMIYGVYLVKHIAPSNDEEDKTFTEKHNLDDNADN